MSHTAAINGIFLNASISDYNGVSTVNAFVKHEAGVGLSGINSFLAENKKKYKGAKASYDGQAVTVIIPNSLKLNVGTVSGFFSDFSQFLANAGYFSECSFCTKTDGLGYTYQNERVMQVCSECHEKYTSVTDGLKKQREETGSYAKGAAGAIIGGILGMIPWVIVSALGYIAGICGLIMAYLSYKGYILLNGRRSRGMLFIIIAVLIVFTYTAIIVDYTIADYGAFPGDKSDIPVMELFAAEFVSPFSEGYVVFGDYYLTMDTGAMWAQIGLGWFFAALGSFFFLRNIRKESKGGDLEVKRITESTEK